MRLPKHKFKLYCKNNNKCGTASTISIGMVMDQIERRPFDNHSGGNSLFGFIHGVIVAMWKTSKINLPHISH